MASNLTLKNAADVNVTYTPMVVKTGEYVRYDDKTQGVLKLQPRATLAVSEKNGRRKGTATATYHKLLSDGTVKTGYVSTTWDIPDDFDTNDRVEVRKRGGSLADTTEVIAAIESGVTP